ncbi:sodium channel protein type 4 subunit alpha B-like [Pholidichthys leucotaenia]
MSFFDFWESRKEKEELLRRAKEHKLSPAQLNLLGNGDVRTALQNDPVGPLLPPVGTEVFRRFTAASLEELQKHRGTKEEEKQAADEDKPKPAACLESGKTLPFFYGDPSPQLLHTPLEDLDPFYQKEKTFMVLSRGNVIHRFNADSACFLLTPFSCLRTVAVRMLTHLYPSTLVFLIIYVFEVAVKITARGFCMGRFTFIRDPWNWLDIINIVSGLCCLILYIRWWLISLMMIARVLKIFTFSPGTKKMVESLLRSVRQLAAAAVVTVFTLLFLAMTGLQLFIGALRNKCVSWPIDNDTLSQDDFDFHYYVNNQSTHYIGPQHADAMLCGNSSDSWACPANFACLKTATNPNYGYTSFDNFGWSLLSVLRILTQDYWDDLMRLILRSVGNSSVTLFVLLFLPVCFFVLSLIVAAVVRTVAEEEEAETAEAKRKDEEFRRVVEVLKKKEEEETKREQQTSVSAEEESEKKENADATKEAEQQRCSRGRRFHRRFQTFVISPYFDLAIIILLILNVFFLAMMHYPMTVEFEVMVAVANLVFTCIFAAEMVIKFAALGCRGYFKVRWHIFDFILVILSLLELGLADIEGVYVGINVLRVFRLARWWPSLHLYLRLIWSAVGIRSVFVLAMVFLFYITGTNIFRHYYIVNFCRSDASCSLPRWHMVDTFHSYLLVFRILCGEWIETMWDCMQVSHEGVCVIYFMLVLVVGNLLVLLLFLNLLFGSLISEQPKENETNNVQAVVNQARTWITERVRTSLGWKDDDDPELKDAKQDYVALSLVTSDKSDLNGDKASKAPVAEAEIEFKVLENPEEKQHQQKQLKDEENPDRNTPEDCCCNCCYRCCPFLDINTSEGTGKGWFNFRKSCLSIVEHRLFEAFIIIVIVLSCLALVFEDIHKSQRMVVVLDIADIVFTVLFLVEMLLKWAALGFRKYFTSFWCWIDFLVLAISMVHTFGIMMGVTSYSLRAVRPLRLFSRFKGIRVVFRSLALTLPSMVDVLLPILTVWLVFSSMGVNMFGGKFYHCYNETSEELFLASEVPNKTNCFYLIEANETDIRWMNNKFHFNNVLEGFLSLFIMATSGGWLDIMYSAVDSTMVEGQPMFESSVYLYLYFVYFIIFGCFFALIFFLRVFFDRIHQQRHKINQTNATPRHVFITEKQQKYCQAIWIRFHKKPKKPGPRPQNQCLGHLYDLVTSPRFDMVKMVVIFLNMLPLMMESFDMSQKMEEFLHFSHFAFILIFLVEFILKIIALRHHYFRSALNVLDFVVLLVSIAGLFLADFAEKYFISVHFFPIFRLVLIFRILRYIPYTGGIRTLLLGFTMSLPALFNIGLLLFFIVFTYAIIGMFNFPTVTKEALIDDMFGFETFGQSMISMITVTTSSSWEGLLMPIMNTPPDCNPLENSCGSPAAGVAFFVSYVVIFCLLLIHLFIAVVLEVFNTRCPEEPSDEQLRMFCRTWRNFDPDVMQVLQQSQLSDFCDALPQPLRIPKPNSDDLPLLPGDQISCEDVVRALVDQAFGGSGPTLRTRLEEAMALNKTKKATSSEDELTDLSSVDGTKDVSVSSGPEATSQ